MQSRIDKIKEALSPLSPSYVEIIDNSHLHRGHEGAKSGKGHFELKINADGLKNKSKIQQHRLIYQQLIHLFETDIHALEIKILS